MRSALGASPRCAVASLFFPEADIGVHVLDEAISALDEGIGASDEDIAVLDEGIEGGGAIMKWILWRAPELAEEVLA